jgi:hypothetical protein
MSSVVTYTAVNVCSLFGQIPDAKTCREIHSQHAAGNQLVIYESRRHAVDKTMIQRSSLRRGYT